MHGNCRVVNDYVNISRSNTAVVGKFVIVGLAIVHLLKEVFQVTQVSFKELTCRKQSSERQWHFGTVDK